LELEIDGGEFLVLAGRNGAGKTILAKHLAGLVEPTEGRVLFEGRPFSSHGASPALLIGYVFQDARLQAVGDRVIDDAAFGPTNLGMKRIEAEGRGRAALARCGLAGKENAFVHSLSGGELRRLAIAGVVAMSPRALILDEPFANLDRDGVSAVLRIVEALRIEGLAVLMVTHELEKVLGLADRLVVMDDGKLVLDGEPGTVLAAGIEAYGLRDPLRSRGSVGELAWLS
jgi:biotin transport system ATP-binding protein